MKQLPREMTNYEKIKYLLEMWVYSFIRVEYKDWMQFDYYVFDSLLRYEVRDEDVKSITPIPNPPKLLPVGTKVRVFEEYVDSDWWDMSKQERDIKDVFDCCYKIWIIGIRWVWAYEVPFRAVYPVFED